MTVTGIDKDPIALTMSITAEFDAPVEHVWQLWADPRLLERWWGPPTYPATFVDHELTPGGTVTYYMTGPDGEQPRGWWKVVAVDPPHRLEVDDGFADADGAPVSDMPVTRMVATLEPTGGGTRMVIRSTFASAEQMEQLVEMGMDEGMREALGQADALLAEVASRS